MSKYSVEEMIALYEASLNRIEDYDASGFLLGLCYIKLKDNKRAKFYFEKSLQHMLMNQRAAWKVAAQPDWLVNVWIFSGRMDLYETVRKSFFDFKIETNEPVANSPISLYAESVLELFSSNKNDDSILIDQLTKKPKIKDIYAMGEVIRGILNRNVILYQQALLALLAAHAGKAKYGMLRWTSEGYFCMSAMALAYIAQTRGIENNFTHEYFSSSYLAFLINRKILFL